MWTSDGNRTIECIGVELQHTLANHAIVLTHVLSINLIKTKKEKRKDQGRGDEALVLKAWQIRDKHFSICEKIWEHPQSQPESNIRPWVVSKKSNKVKANSSQGKVGATRWPLGG